VRTERGVLLAGHPRRAEAVLAGAVAAVEREDGPAAAAALEDFMDEEALQAAEVRGRSGVTRAGCAGSDAPGPSPGLAARRSERVLGALLLLEAAVGPPHFSLL